MSFIRHATGAAALALFLLARISAADAAAGDYRFELAGNPESAGGKSIIAVRLTHVPDRKSVPGAIIIQTRADMGPDGMQEMTAPVKALPPKAPGGLPRDWGCGSKRVLSGSLIGERRQRGLDREAGKHRGRGRRTQHGGYADRPT